MACLLKLLWRRSYSFSSHYLWSKTLNLMMSPTMMGRKYIRPIPPSGQRWQVGRGRQWLKSLPFLPSPSLTRSFSYRHQDPVINRSAMAYTSNSASRLTYAIIPPLTVHLMLWMTSPAIRILSPFQIVIWAINYWFCIHLLHFLHICLYLHGPFSVSMYHAWRCSSNAPMLPPLRHKGNFAGFVVDIFH